MTNLLRLTALSAFGLACTLATTQTVTCPPAPNGVKVRVDAQVAHDSATKLYRYTYTVNNDASSAQDVDAVDIDFAGTLSEIANPAGWTHAIHRKRSTLDWAATESAPLPEGTPDDGTIPPAIAQIKSGASLGGFSFVSPKPPGPVKYYVAGYVPTPSYASEEEAETAVEQCPTSTGDFFKLAAVGTTLGPVDFIPVDIATKPMAAPPVSINPRENGVTPVAVLGSRSYDVATIDQASVRLGPGNAAPTKTGGHWEDVNNDGLPDLVFQFPSQSIGATCNDTALFLTGRTQDGTGIQGSEEIRTVGCDAASKK